MDEDYCYECTGYGNDYFVNDEGEMEWRCLECPFNPLYYNDE
jgi:hypothetical protein